MLFWIVTSRINKGQKTSNLHRFFETVTSQYAPSFEFNGSDAISAAVLFSSVRKIHPSWKIEKLYPDPYVDWSQNLIDSRVDHTPSTQNISWKSVHNFLEYRNLVDRQTNIGEISGVEKMVF